MAVNDRSWMRLHFTTNEWQKGFKEFIQFKFGGTGPGETAPCPCRRCRSVNYRTKTEVESHLTIRGFDESFIEETDDFAEASNNAAPMDESATDDRSDVSELVSSLIRGAIHGDIIGTEEPNKEAKKFFKLLTEGKKELYPGCKEVTKISFIVRIFQIKCMFGLSNNALQAILQLFSLVLPEGHCVPDTLDKVQKVVRDLGLDYEKIHACVNDCVLFRKKYADLEKCPTCGESRWKVDVAKRRVPQKILRYFPVTPRLQRLYMNPTTSGYMRWHNDGRVRDGKVRHPADSKAWKHIDDTYKGFSSDPRNVRLGLASDGFNPFGMLNVSYSTWPVILIPYNLPPWYCLKQPFWMLSLLIPGPKSPGNNIDVYLQPLIDELKDLWTKGVETWDAKEKKNFQLHALLMWTISDFPAYAMLSGWSTKGKFACPYCHKDTDFLWLKFGGKHCYMGHRRFLPMNHKWHKNKISFNNKVEIRESPVPLSGKGVRQQYESFEQVTFGKSAKKRKQREEECRWHNWRKKSIFFELPYWENLLVRHNLDVMHIEKNICESILGTLLEMAGKSKDSEKARLDMQHLGIRKDQQLVMEGGQYKMPSALYSLGKTQMTSLCKFLEGVKMPDGYASNIKRAVDVNSCKLSGLKSHDCHVIFQKLLPIEVRNILPEGVATPLIELSRFFNAICSKELSAEELDQLMTTSISETLCRLEMIFPPSFFDIMVHLPVHLAKEAKLGGPVCYRWMYPIERYLRTVKGYVRNKAHPEGSMAEGYLSEECLTFCSRFLADIENKVSRPERHEAAVVNEPPAGLSIFADIDNSKKGFSRVILTKVELQRMRHYIIKNCDEVIPWINEHMDELRKLSHRNVEQRHRQQFVGWFERRINKLRDEGKASDMIYGLSQGPDERARSFKRCFMNEFLFRTAESEENLNTQNSGVVVAGDKSTGNIDWYGVIKQIIALDFPFGKEVILFQCDWFDVPGADRNKGRGYQRDIYGIIDIDITRRRYLDEPYILGTQAEQMFYVKGAKNPKWRTVVRMKPRKLFPMPEPENIEKDDGIDIDSLDVGVQDMIDSSSHEVMNWTRSDIQGVSGDSSVIDKAIAECVDEPHDLGLEDEDDDGDDTYIDDGYVAPVHSSVEGADDEFFV